MNKLILTLGTTLLIGGALAQTTSFPDVPEESFATDAVAELVELGIITGFPDGTFRGNEAFTRYQAALVISRLLDVIEEESAAIGALSEEDLATLNNAVQQLSSELDGLDARIAALEDAGAQVDAGESALSGEVSALGERLSALEAMEGDTQLAGQVTTLEERVAALEAAGDVTALQEQVNALNTQVNELQTQLEAVQVPAADTPLEDAVDAVTDAVEPDVDLAAPLAAPDAVAFAPERGNFYLGLAPFYEVGFHQNGNGTDQDDNEQVGDGVGSSQVDQEPLGPRFRPRVTIGVDDAIAGFGVRATADYGRQTLIEAGSLALSGHLTYTIGVPAVSGYLGVGGGYQFSNLIFTTNTYEGAFAGALLGAEIGTGPITFFVEGTADYYLEDVPVANYDRIYPTVAAGFNFRP